jgi:DDE superfamily endonuclease
MVRESLYVFAAVCPQLGHVSALILPYANSQMMTLFLAHVAAALSAYFIVMLVDRAGWHLSHQVAVPENIRLLPQPPGSPELNPTEHLWEDLRENEAVGPPRRASGVGSVGGSTRARRTFHRYNTPSVTRWSKEDAVLG